LATTASRPPTSPQRRQADRGQRQRRADHQVAVDALEAASGASVSGAALRTVNPATRRQPASAASASGLDATTGAVGQVGAGVGRGRQAVATRTRPSATARLTA
jgi:hypothetical protein